MNVADHFSAEGWERMILIFPLTPPHPGAHNFVFKVLNQSAIFSLISGVKWLIYFDTADRCVIYFWYYRTQVVVVEGNKSSLFQPKYRYMHRNRWVEDVWIAISWWMFHWVKLALTTVILGKRWWIILSRMRGSTSKFYKYWDLIYLQCHYLCYCYPNNNSDCPSIIWLLFVFRYSLTSSAFNSERNAILQCLSFICCSISVWRKKRTTFQSGRGFNHFICSTGQISHRFPLLVALIISLDHSLFLVQSWLWLYLFSSF